MPITLTPARRQLLNGKAHRLHPWVMVGDESLTPAVVPSAVTNGEDFKGA